MSGESAEAKSGSGRAVQLCCKRTFYSNGFTTFHCHFGGRIRIVVTPCHRVHRRRKVVIRVTDKLLGGRCLGWHADFNFKCRRTCCYDYFFISTVDTRRATSQYRKSQKKERDGRRDCCALLLAKSLPKRKSRGVM